MDVKGPRLDVHFIDSDGTAKDNFTLTKSGHTCGGSFNLPNNQWQQISLPCKPDSKNKVSDMFANMPGTYRKDWIIFGYDPAKGYINIDAEDSLDQGAGYWIIQKSGNPVTLTMPQGSTPTTTTPCASPQGCFEIPLTTKSGKHQWNMIGYPYAAQSDLNNVSITTGSGSCNTPAGCNLDIAKDQSLVQNQLWTYNGNGRKYTIINSGDTINSWTGYWAATLSEAAKVKPVKMLIPASN
jgi:hypothetical protein